MITLPSLDLPRPNPCVLRHLARTPLRDPQTACGRPLYLQRLGMVVLPHQRVAATATEDAGWVCTAAGGSLDVRSPVGAFVIGDVEIAAGLEVRDVCHPLLDLSPTEFCEAWLVRVWDRFPGGRRLQAAQALLEFVELDSLTVATAPAWQPDLARRAGLVHARGVARHCAELSTAGLLSPRFGVPATRPDDEQRRYRLQLPPAVAA
ncbi:hypothetical protein [Pseudonocardia lacus]|uniref:hypothetical protein n=1 Tax=Pseudonocardia lacus TaxID=2835865 RepID=UPI001BDC357C|nr:hypothetical protein [Pseudonocardia lacus]